MKKIIGRISLTLMCIAALTACSKENIENELPDDSLNEIPINIDTRTLPTGVTGTLYIFGKLVTDNEFKLQEIVDFGNTDTQMVTILAKEALEKSYRFFFLAEPTPSQITKTGLSINDTWSQIRLEIPVSSPLNESHYYYGFVDKVGSNLINATIPIEISLKRLVGQPVVDIFRVEDNDLAKPIPVSSEVTSVLDRVSMIEIEYTGLCTVIRFAGNGEVINDNSGGSGTQTITPKLGVDYTLDITDPENIEKGLSLSGKGTNGSARISGIFGFPSNNVKMKCTFHYYHTTPSYETRTIELNLPSQFNSIEIKPNMYTINNVGITEDRIIDVNVSGGFNFDLEWESDK